MKKQDTDWEKIFVKYSSDGLFSKTYKERTLEVYWGENKT